jgi:uncharacterized protein Yka (UPF0111/DUF47 family)
LSGPDTEFQARRRTIIVLQDEMRRVLDAARVLLDEYDALVKGDKMLVAASLEKVKKAEEDVAMLRNALIRELGQVGTLVVNREDLLRTAFSVEEMFGHINGIAFKMSQLPKSIAKNKRYREALTSLLGLLLDGISKLNDSIRGLSINPEQSIHVSTEVQQIESAIDAKYREASVLVFSMSKYMRIQYTIISREVLEAIEDCADAMLRAANSTTVLALGL